MDVHTKVRLSALGMLVLVKLLVDFPVPFGRRITERQGGREKEREEGRNSERGRGRKRERRRKRGREKRGREKREGEKEREWKKERGKGGRERERETFNHSTCMSSNTTRTYYVRKMCV